MTSSFVVSCVGLKGGGLTFCVIGEIGWDIPSGNFKGLRGDRGCASGVGLGIVTLGFTFSGVGERG